MFSTNLKVQKLINEVTTYTENILNKNKKSINKMANRLLETDEIRITELRKLLGKNLESSL